MDKISFIRDTLQGYDNHTNNLPAEDVEEISEKEYLNLYFMHHWEYSDSKQITDKKLLNANESYVSARILLKKGFSDDLSIGIMITTIHPEFIPRYWKFGPWQTFNRKFSAQFRGDNS